ncbi:MAG: S41 family peptidase [Deinococcota bacterium]|jgi:carboxyl-terminal processing protease|nr:S41 family peptidase [Deinococcota bacterium]
MKHKALAGTLVALALTFAVVQAQFSRDFSDDFLNSSSGRSLIQVYNALRSNYLTDIDNEAVIQGAITGMIEALEDPYTNYASPEMAARSQQDRLGSFEGIGVTIEARNRQDGTVVAVTNVYRDGPAAEAGIQRGDLITEVDGVNVERTHINDIVSMIRGPGGTEVTIGMRRANEEELITFTITRATIQIVSVESALLPDEVGYLSINTFANRRVYEQLQIQLEALQAQGATSLILDLRNNGGGFLDQGILVADEFLSSGDIVFRRAQGVTIREAQADPQAFELPMVVLVNQNSASASEIVAGALQDNGRALVVGEPTLGKGVGQNVITLADGGELSFVTFEWLTPNRQSITETGIQPDVVVEDTSFPSIISLQGQGASEGQEIQFMVDGEVIGSAVAGEDGEFTFFQPFTLAERSDVPGLALIDLDNDNALRVAYDTVREVWQAANP